MILTFKIIDFSVEIIDCDMFHSSPCPRSRVIDFAFSKSLILTVKINDFEGAATDIDFGPEIRKINKIISTSKSMSQKSLILTPENHRFCVKNQ